MSDGLIPRPIRSSDCAESLGEIFFALAPGASWQPLHRREYARAEPLLEAEVFLERVAVLLRAPGQELRLADTLVNLAEVRAAKGHLEEAEHLHLESIALYEDLVGVSHQETLYARRRFGAFLRKHGRADEATRFIKRLPQ